MVLHLAHHKSYHPYKAENIARVKRDEEQAALEAEQRQGRTLQADSESRLNLLRSQAKKKRNVVKDAEKALDRVLAHGESNQALVTRDEDDGPIASTSRTEISSIRGADGHFNFFSEAGSASSSRAGNAEYMAEKKAADDKWEAMITMKLGGREQVHKPWYADADLKSHEESTRTSDQRDEMAYKDGQSKKAHDPLELMSAYLSRRDEVIRDNERRRRDPFAATPTPRSSAVEPKLLAPSRRERERQKARDDARADREAEDELRPAQPQQDKPAPDLELAARSREMSERERAKALIRAKKASSTFSTPRSEYSDRYNPDAMRRDDRRRW